MFTIRFQTNTYRPDLDVSIRCDVIGDWQQDIGGNFSNDAWVFVLDENPWENPFEFKFVLEEQVWMAGNNLKVDAVNGAEFTFTDDDVTFPPITEAIVENGIVSQTFFPRNYDANMEHDVIVIGSGFGGGVVANTCSNFGLKTLVLELGSYLFPTHVANLPRQHPLNNNVDKHIWHLWDEFKTTNYVNQPGSTYGGGQGFCLGGRSVFWGGFIPRMSWWEMELWPTNVQWYMENGGYDSAEELLKKSVAQSGYQTQVLNYFRTHFNDYQTNSAPMAVHQPDSARNMLSTGVFSSADLLMESMLSAGPQGTQNLTINLNQAVTQLEWQGDKITGVNCWDLQANMTRTYKAKHIVLAAGTVESAKIALLSNLKNPNNLIGKGMTDHPIYFTHFRLPDTSPLFNIQAGSKILLRHKNANANQHRYNILIELGADFNQNRYVDKAIYQEMQEVKDNSMLCEIVFLFNTQLNEDNRLNQFGASGVKPQINMFDAGISGAEWNEINAVQNDILSSIGALPILNQQPLQPAKADLGGVAHEVGTMRMGEPGLAVVDENLQFHGYDNLHVCDLSVFPSSPAANPSLTLAALALRLGERLKGQITQ